MTNPEYRILDVIPHGEPMSLLDDIVDYSATGLVAGVTIRPDSLFCEERGVPAWVGIEYMGQAVAAFAGVSARNSGLPVKIGFLVSARRYESPLSYFAIGARLRIEVEQITENTTGLGVFACAIIGEGIDIRTNLNVYLPENIAEFFQG